MTATKIDSELNCKEIEEGFSYVPKGTSIRPPLIVSATWGYYAGFYGNCRIVISTNHIA